MSSDHRGSRAADGAGGIKLTGDAITAISSFLLALALAALVWARLFGLV